MKLLAIALLFGKLSLLAVGGVNSTVPEISRVVEARHWVSPAQFSQLYAISQAAPGPNMLISTVLGAQVAGLAGGLVATLAMMLPAGVLVILVSSLWERYRAHPWRRVVQAALLPISAGLVLAAGCTLLKAADRTIMLGVITAIVAALNYRTGLHPLLLLAGGVAVGLVFS